MVKDTRKYRVPTKQYLKIEDMLKKAVNDVTDNSYIMERNNKIPIALSRDIDKEEAIVPSFYIRKKGRNGEGVENPEDSVNGLLSSAFVFATGLDITCINVFVPADDDPLELLMYVPPHDRYCLEIAKAYEGMARKKDIVTIRDMSRVFG